MSMYSARVQRLSQLQHTCQLRACRMSAAVLAGCHFSHTVIVDFVLFLSLPLSLLCCCCCCYCVVFQSTRATLSRMRAQNPCTPLCTVPSRIFRPPRRCSRTHSPPCRTTPATSKSRTDISNRVCRCSMHSFTITRLDQSRQSEGEIDRLLFRTPFRSGFVRTLVHPPSFLTRCQFSFRNKFISQLRCCA